MATESREVTKYCHSRVGGNLLPELPEILDQVGDDKLKNEE